MVTARVRGGVGASWREKLDSPPYGCGLNEDEIRSVEGPDALTGSSEGTAPLITSRSLDKGHDNSLRHDLIQPPLGIRA